MKRPATSGNAGVFAPFEWLLALRYLRARRREGSVSIIAVFSVAGIMVGVAALIIVLSVMNGFRQEMLDKFLGLHSHVIVKPLGRTFTGYSETAERLKAVPGVKSTLAVIEGRVMISSEAGSSGVVVRGMGDQDLNALQAISNNIRYGSLEGFGESGGIAIGTRLANSLNVFVGSEVSIMAPRGASTVLGTMPRMRSYPVKAIFEAGSQEYDSMIAFIPLREAQSFFNVPGSVHFLEVMLGDPDKVGSMLGALRDAGGPKVVLSDWRQRDATFDTALKVERNVMFVIVMLTVLVATLNIISGLAVLVKNKARDIAVLRTMGATRGAIMRVFFISGTSIGVLGTFLGFVLGVTVSIYLENIRQFLFWVTSTPLSPSEGNFLSRLPTQLDSGEVAVVVTVSLLLSMGATIYPALQAARLDPVEALRYE